MFFQSTLAILAAASGASALVPRGVCNADNCLRALRATNPQTRLIQAQADCAAWLTVTSTPVETAIAYTTVADLTSTLVEDVTTTETVHSVSTSTVHETPTETVYTSTVTVTVDPVNVVTKRAAAPAAPTIPAYASPCSGAVRYSSACSCIGASSAMTVTAPTSTTTVTIPTTALTTVPATSVVATSVTVVYDSTTIVTVTEAPVTVSAVTTVTTTSVAPVEPTQLLTNGDFEASSSVSPWLPMRNGGTLSLDTTKSHSTGSQSAHVTYQRADVAGIYQAVTPKVGQNYVFSIWVQRTNPACSYFYTACNTGPNSWFGLQLKNLPNANEWVQGSITCNWNADRAPNAGVSVIFPNNCVVGGQLYLDDAIVLKQEA